MLDESGVANGVYGYKQDSVHVAWVGGIAYREYQDGGVIRTDRTKLVSVDNRTDAQKVALFDLLRDTVYRSSVDSVRVTLSRREETYTLAAGVYRLRQGHDGSHRPAGPVHHRVDSKTTQEFFMMV